MLTEVRSISRQPAPSQFQQRDEFVSLRVPVVCLQRDDFNRCEIGIVDAVEPCIIGTAIELLQSHAVFADPRVAENIEELH